jgi:hypothetical protein
VLARLGQGVAHLDEETFGLVELSSVDRAIERGKELSQLAQSESTCVSEWVLHRISQDEMISCPVYFFYGRARPFHSGFRPNLRRSAG